MKMKQPSRTIKVGSHEVRMCHGLMMDLQRVIPDLQSCIPSVIEEPFVRDYLVRRALTSTPKSVEKEEDLVSHDFLDDLDTDEVLDLIDWLTEHLLYFFVQSASRMTKLAEKALPKDQIPPSLDGSEDSTSTKPPAGPSTVATETSGTTSSGDTTTSKSE